MARKHAKKLGLTAAGVAGLVAAGAFGSPDAAAVEAKPSNLKQQADECPQAAAISIPNLIEARKSGNESAASGALRTEAGKKGPLRKKAAKKAVKKAAKKAAKKATHRRTARRDPC